VASGGDGFGEPLDVLCEPADFVSELVELGVDGVGLGVRGVVCCHEASSNAASACCLQATLDSPKTRSLANP
jgi:hypothetical protein